MIVSRCFEPFQFPQDINEIKEQLKDRVETCRDITLLGVVTSLRQDRPVTLLLAPEEAASGSVQAPSTAQNATCQALPLCQKHEINCNSVVTVRPSSQTKVEKVT